MIGITIDHQKCSHILDMRLELLLGWNLAPHTTHRKTNLATVVGEKKLQ
jgi:hypothetical protein